MNTNNSSDLLRQKILQMNKGNKESNKPNPLKMLKEKQSQTAGVLKEAQNAAHDANKVVLISVDTIDPLIMNGEVMHNRSGMSTKDKEELQKFADSLIISKKDRSGLFGTGLINAIVVRESNEINRYEIISGFRRLESFKLNKETHIPAFVIKCDNKIARRLRNAENKQRRAVNAYDETYGELEEILLYCGFASFTDTEKALRKAKKIQDKEKSILKKYTEQESVDDKEILSKNSSYTIQEFEDAENLALAVNEITQKALSTFVNRLEILNICPSIKAHLINDNISYSEALVLKKIAKEDEVVIDNAVKYLIASEAAQDNRISVKEFEKYLKDKTGYENKERGHKTTPLSEFKRSITSLSDKKYQNMTDEDKSELDKIMIAFANLINKRDNN